MKGWLSVMTEINSAFQNDRMVHSDIDYLSSALSSTVIIHHKFVGFIKCVFFSVITQTCYCCFSELEKNVGVSLHARCAIAAHVYDEIDKVKTPGLVLFCFSGAKGWWDLLTPLKEHSWAPKPQDGNNGHTVHCLLVRNYLLLWSHGEKDSSCGSFWWGKFIWHLGSNFLQVGNKKVLA